MKRQTKAAGRNRSRGVFGVAEFVHPVSGSVSWRVAGTEMDGTRVRMNFATQAEALGEKQRLELATQNLTPDDFLRRTWLTKEQLRDCEAAIRQLGDHSLPAAVDFFLRHHREAAKRSTVRDAVDLFLGDMRSAKRRPATLKNLEVRLGLLVRVAGDTLVNEVLTDTVRSVVNRPGCSPRSRDNQRRAMSRFFAWAIAQKMVDFNPVAALPAVAQAEIECDPVVLSVEQARRLMVAAEAFKGGRMVPYCALTLFAGLRPSEAARCDWSSVDLQRGVVHVTKATSKTKHERDVALSGNAIEWLARHGALAQPIAGPNFAKDFIALRRLAGLGHGRGEGHWQQDTLRHSAASFYCARTQDEGKTATWCGHSVSVLRRHYKRLVEHPEDVAAFWNIRPGDAASKIIRLAS